MTNSGWEGKLLYEIFGVKCLGKIRLARSDGEKENFSQGKFLPYRASGGIGRQFVDKNHCMDCRRHNAAGGKKRSRGFF